MEEYAQGRVWTGNDAASRGLVDALGGFSRAVAIAKQKANIPEDRQVGLRFPGYRLYGKIQLNIIDLLWIYLPHLEISNSLFPISYWTLMNYFCSDIGCFTL